MTKYAYIVFTPGEEETERNVLIALNSLGIITVAREDIDKWYDEFKETQYPQHDEFVLHDEHEITAFKLMMKSFFPEKKYELINKPGSLSFQKWLEDKQTRKDAP